jgi:hypothetical protein
MGVATCAVPVADAAQIDLSTYPRDALLCHGYLCFYHQPGRSRDCCAVASPRLEAPPLSTSTRTIAKSTLKFYDKFPLLKGSCTLIIRRPESRRGSADQVGVPKAQSFPDSTPTHRLRRTRCLKEGLLQEACGDRALCAKCASYTVQHRWHVEGLLLKL